MPCSGAIAYEVCEKKETSALGKQAAGTKCGRSQMSNLSREVWARRCRIRKLEVQRKSRPFAVASCSILYGALLDCGRLRGPVLQRSGRTFLAAAVSDSTNFPLISHIFRQSARRRAARIAITFKRRTAFFKSAWCVNGRALSPCRTCTDERQHNVIMRPAYHWRHSLTLEDMIAAGMTACS